MWSRFRLTNTLRDDGPLLTSCCFLRGFETLVAGTASGELKLHDAYKYVAVDFWVLAAAERDIPFNS